MANVPITSEHVDVTFTHDPANTGLCCSTYTFSNGTKANIDSAHVLLDFSDKHVQGTVSVQTSKGAASIDVNGCICPCL